MTTSLADQFAFAAHKVPIPSTATRQERVRWHEHMLCRALNLKTVVAFVGAACSTPFGYATWEGFARKVIEKTSEQPAAAAHKDRLRIYAEILEIYAKSDNYCPSEQLTLFIATCKSILDGAKDKGIYKNIINEQFGTLVRKTPPREQDPHQELFSLEINRFVTTNYDIELERSLICAHNLEPDDEDLKKHLPDLDRYLEPGRRRTLRSFSQNSTNFEHLALFSLAQVRGSEYAVFHCHGRFDDLESLIASEEDYQKWYLSEGDDSKRTFRQTIELLLESNPLLFVGYGLGDDDLLRPLRHLNALDPKHRYGRPLFALVPVPSDDDKDIRGEVLYQRYGVHVIPYVAPIRDSDQANIALCEKLREIKTLWNDDRAEWTEKPKLRSSCLGQIDTATRSYPLAIRASNVAVGRMKDAVDFEHEISQPGIFGLRGPSGAGKSLLLTRLLGRAEELGFARTYYWNAHYGTEFLPAFDDALAFFEAGDNPRESRHDKMRRILCEQRVLLVIDGCERFLRRTHSERIESYSSAFSLLLKQLDGCALCGTVIFAGRLLPAEFAAPKAAAKGWHELRISKPVMEDVEAASAAAGCRPVVTTEICSLLRGHNYGLLLAGRYIERFGEAGRTRLLQRLADRPPNQRLATLLRLFVRDLDDEAHYPDYYQAFLERLARFVSPVCKSTCEACHDEAIRETKAEPKTIDLDVALETLLRTDLIFTIRQFANGAQVGTPEERYCVHASARSLLLQPRHGPAADALPDFGISGLTSSRVDAYPDWNRQGQIVGLFNDVMKRSEGSLREADSSSTGAEACRQAAELCADGFALLRGTMAANTAGRWGAFDQYIGCGIRLARLAKALCVTAKVGTWSYCEYFDRGHIERTDAPLHSSEIAWLYNDIGLALSAEGALRDAYAVWEQAFEITRAMEHFKPGGGYRLEVLLNLTHVFIEMGRLREARFYLNDAGRMNDNLRDADFGGRILGFQGLLAHLSGNLPEADSLYAACTRKLRHGNNLRAQSVFLKYYADLNLTMGTLDKAALLIQKSRALAEAGVFPDLVAFTRVSQATLLTQKKQYDDARREYLSLLRESHRMGARKLEAECQSTLSVLCLQEGDVEGARVRAMRALSLANELALGLRLTHSMIVLGQATVKAGQRDLGIAYLRNARFLAAEQEYWLRRWKAETALQELGVDV